MSGWTRISNSGLRKTIRNGYQAFPSRLAGSTLEMGLARLLGTRAGFEQRGAIVKMNSVWIHNGRTGKMAQCLKLLATKFDHLSLISKVHVKVEGKNQSCRVVI